MTILWIDDVPYEIGAVTRYGRDTGQCLVRNPRRNESICVSLSDAVLTETVNGQTARERAVTEAVRRVWGKREIL